MSLAVTSKVPLVDNSGDEAGSLLPHALRPATHTIIRKERTPRIFGAHCSPESCAIGARTTWTGRSTASGGKLADKAVRAPDRRFKGSLLSLAATLNPQETSARVAQASSPASLPGVPARCRSEGRDAT